MGTVSADMLGWGFILVGEGGISDLGGDATPKKKKWCVIVIVLVVAKEQITLVRDREREEGVQRHHSDHKEVTMSSVLLGQTLI